MPGQVRVVQTWPGTLLDAPAAGTLPVMFTVETAAYVRLEVGYTCYPCWLSTHGVMTMAVLLAGNTLFPNVAPCCCHKVAQIPINVMKPVTA